MLADAGVCAGILAEIGWREGAAGFAADARATLDQASAAASSVKMTTAAMTFRIVIAINLRRPASATRLWRPLTRSTSAALPGSPARWGDCEDPRRGRTFWRCAKRSAVSRTASRSIASRCLRIWQRARRTRACWRMPRNGGRGAGGRPAVKDAHRRDVALEAAAVVLPMRRSTIKRSRWPIRSRRVRNGPIMRMSARMLKQLRGRTCRPHREAYHGWAGK